MKSLALYFDFSSPYSYLFWCSMTKGRLLCDLDEFRAYPVFMGSVITHFVNRGPAEIPSKRDFLFRQALRQAHKLDIPLNCPAKLLFNPLAILRAATTEASGAHQQKVISAFFNGVWRDGVDMEDEQKLYQLLEEALESPSLADEIMSKACERPAKVALKKNSRAAIELGVFGVPTVLWNDELFWGVESLGPLERALRGEDEYNRNVYQEFKRLMATSLNKSEGVAEDS